MQSMCQLVEYGTRRIHVAFILLWNYVDILYIDLSWCSLSVSGYNEYGNSRSNEFDEFNLGFSGVVYNIASLHFETHQLAHHYDFTDEQPNSGA